MLACRTPEELARMVPPLDVAFAWLVRDQRTVEQLSPQLSP